MDNFKISNTFSVTDLMEGYKVSRNLFNMPIIEAKPQDEAQMLERYKELKILE